MGPFGGKGGRDVEERIVLEEGRFLADLEELNLTAYTVLGPIVFHSQGKPGNRRITLSLPEGMQGELVLAQSEKIDLPLINQDQPIGCARYRMTANQLAFTLLNS